MIHGHSIRYAHNFTALCFVMVTVQSVQMTRTKPDPNQCKVKKDFVVEGIVIAWKKWNKTYASILGVHCLCGNWSISLGFISRVCLAHIVYTELGFFIIIRFLFFGKELSYVSKLNLCIVSCEVKMGDVVGMFIVRYLDCQNDTLSVRS